MKGEQNARGCGRDEEEVHDGGVLFGQCSQSLEQDLYFFQVV